MMRDGPKAMANASDVERFRENWQDEVDSAAEYRALATVEPDPKIAEVRSSPEWRKLTSRSGKIDCAELEHLCMSGARLGAAEY
jgi:hypothetical protein